MDENVITTGGLVFLCAVSVVLLLAIGPAVSAQNAQPTATVQPTVTIQPSQQDSVQVVNIRAVRGAYDPKVVRVKAGIPVELRFSADASAGCNSNIVFPDFGVQLSAARGGNAEIARFTPQTQGTFGFSCSMGMISGTLIVE